jgi:hypothetical protein
MAGGSSSVYEGAKKVEVVLRVGDNEESILHLVWNPVAADELEKYHQLDGKEELAAVLAAQIAVSIAHEDGKAVKEAILRMIEHTRAPLRVVVTP